MNIERAELLHVLFLQQLSYEQFKREINGGFSFPSFIHPTIQETFIQTYCVPGNVIGSKDPVVAEKQVPPSESSKSSEEARERGSLFTKMCRKPYAA